MQFETEIATSDTDHPLVPSHSIQNKDGSYLLLEKPDYTELDEFLSGLGIERKDIPVENEYLLKLFQREMSACSWMKWSSLDHALEKCLQWPLLSAHDLGPETKESAWRRVRPAERSILLKSTWGLVKAYAVQGFARGLELGLFTSIHIFIYSMLLYRLVKLIQTGTTSMDEFRSSFISSDQKGIDSLVRLLAGLETRWLRLILTSPFIIAGLQSISSLWRARRTSPATLKNYTQIIDTHLQKKGGWLRDGIYEYLPGISSASLLSLSGKLQKLENLVRWDGRLSSEERTQIFEALCRVAITGKKNTRLNALQYLARIAHGVGFKDLPRLKEAGYSKEELLTMLYIKGKALAVIMSLPKEEIKESKPLRCQAIQSLPQRIYRQYLLWWLLGLKTHVLKQQLPALLLKTAKLTIELYFFQMILFSILEAIRCPDKQGFELGFGYSKYADLLTVDCYFEMVDQFRTINLNDSVPLLVEQTQYFNLDGLHNLTFMYKNLTGEEMVAILRSAEDRGAGFAVLNIFDNFADSDMRSLAAYLNNSIVQNVWLGCYSEDIRGGTNLSDAGFAYLAQVLPFMKELVSFDICFPNIGDEGIQALADVLNRTHIKRFYLHHTKMGDPGGIQLAEAWSTMPAIERIVMDGSEVGDGTIRALSSVVRNCPVLNELWVDGNSITNAGAIYFANLIQNTSLPRIGLRSTNVTDEGVMALAGVIVNLPVTVLGMGSRSGEEGLITLINQLNKTNIWYLELVYNTFTPKSMEALAHTLPSTQLNYLELDYNNLNDPKLISQLAQGIVASAVDTLIMWDNNISTSMNLLGPAMSKLDYFEIVEGSLTDTSLIDLSPFLPGSLLQTLYLNFNLIGDEGLLALTKVLPDTQITDLSLIQNRITDKGAQVIAQVYPNTSLNVLYLMENNISGDILYQVENYQWQAYCQDQLCHANAQYNGYTTPLTSSDSSPMSRRSSYGRHHLKSSRRYDVFDRDVKRETSQKKIWGAGSSIEVIEDDPLAATTDTTSDHSAGFHTTESLPTWTPPALSNPSSGESSAESLPTSAAAGAMIISTLGLSLLLYKNVTIVQTVANVGCRLLQNCYYRTRDSLKTAANFYSFHSPLQTATRTPLQTDSHPPSFQMLS